MLFYQFRVNFNSRVNNVSRVNFGSYRVNPFWVRVMVLRKIRARDWVRIGKKINLSRLEYDTNTTRDTNCHPYVQQLGRYSFKTEIRRFVFLTFLDKVIKQLINQLLLRFMIINFLGGSLPQIDHASSAQICFHIFDNTLVLLRPSTLLFPWVDF